MQFKQDPRHAVSYASFRTTIECLLRRYVVGNLARGRPNVVVFNEDIGLMLPLIGSRGAQGRRLISDASASPECAGVALCVILKTLAAAGRSYAGPIAYYARRFGTLPVLTRDYIAATDTIVRSFMATFSDLARKYGVYMIGSSTQSPFHVSSAAADINALRDPDLPRPRSVYVATTGSVYNTAFVWGPRNVRRGGPSVRRNLLATNLKVPLTPLEIVQGVTPGPSTGPAAVANLRPTALPGTAARLGIATSLPAFTFGNPPAGTDPCSDTSLYYMRCLDKLGANVVIQDEANDGQWTGQTGSMVWQPLDWMGSTWRDVSDPTVHFVYNVTPMLTGNLGDLTFDGQSAITQRGLRGPGCHYVGNGATGPGDPPSELASLGAKPQFLALAPWVVGDGPRSSLAATGAKLAFGSHDPIEDDYLETALVADLPFPADPGRRDCAGQR
jgi:hypothetical protein